MASGKSVKVFFEPKIERHDPDLYAYEGVAHGIAAADATAAVIREQFDDQGFVLLCGLIPSDKIGAARNALGAMTLSDQPECEMIWYEGGLRDHLALSGDDDQETNGSSAADGFVLGQEGDRLPALDPRLRARFVRKFMGFVAGNPGLAYLAHDPAIVEIVTDLVGGPPRLFQDMALIKPPDGREKPWHQDHAYFNLPLDTPIVGVWLPLGTATPANGCMHVLAGGHRLGPRPHFKRRDWQICDTDVERQRRLAVPMQPGDVLLFDGKLPHGTPVNTTREQRWAIQYHYRPAAAHEVDDAERLSAFGAEGKGVTC